MEDAKTAYESHAHKFLQVRDQSMVGSQVVAEWTRTLDDKAAVLELGCGGGYPITRVLQNEELTLWAVDSSPTLVETFQSRFPDVPVQCASVQEFDFFNRSFDAVVAVGLLFLLPETDQVQLIKRVSDVLVSGGRFLFTAPLEIGDWRDINTGSECVSLGEVTYERLLRENQLQLLSTPTDVGGNNYFDTRRE